MASKHVVRTRDALVKALMDLDKKRDDLYMRNVWNRMQHFIAIYHMEENIDRLARDMPDEIKERLAA